MSGVWGENIKLSIFGESHGRGIGIIISGLPAGLELDLDFLKKELSRRKPGSSMLSTARNEEDEFIILSGYFNGKTNGSPLSFLIENKDQKSGDYEELKETPRPGHADYPAWVKYSGFNDYRGGGHFSGRLTAPLVLAGAIAQQILAQRQIVIGSHILGIGEIREEKFDPVRINQATIKGLKASKFPVLDEAKGLLMQEKILQVKEEKDSLGGILETAVLGLPVGVGSPFFDSVESKLAHLLFAIPAVKGVEFGSGFELTKMRGSQANDQFSMQNGQVTTTTNHSGGIQGGLTNGMPLIFRTAFKPTPSIGLAQRTVHLVKKEEVEIKIKGRHDPCIVPRAVPVVEGVAALALLDLIIEKEGTGWIG
ncbi:MAG TPA: chorismate synthase [Peptococcaceae bacterium]|nr:chorismate synthase [Peptococcaceae bacterium]